MSCDGGCGVKMTGYMKTGGTFAESFKKYLYLMRTVQDGFTTIGMCLISRILFVDVDLAWDW